MSKFKQETGVTKHLLKLCTPQTSRMIMCGWARNDDDISPLTTATNPAKSWSGAQIAPRDLPNCTSCQKVRLLILLSAYYADEILTKSLLPALKCSAKGGYVLGTGGSRDDRRSRQIFVQYGAPSHTSNCMQDWSKLHVSGF